jgi:hypothetical protein
MVGWTRFGVTPTDSKTPTMKLSHVMTEYIWEAYCLF